APAASFPPPPMGAASAHKSDLRLHLPERRLRALQSSCSAELSFHELDKGADTCKRRTVDLVIFHNKPKPLLDQVDHANHRHRIELGDCAEQGCIQVERMRAPTKAEHLIDDGQHFLLDIQNALL